MNLLLEKVATPLSPLLVVTDEDGNLRALEFADYESRMVRLLNRYYGSVVLKKGKLLPSIRHGLAAYFAGDLTAVDQLPTATAGTPFQRLVWKALRAIPAGTTRTYGQLAAEIGHAGASRAVGAANGSNPIAIVVPCHRVIGAKGVLTGYGGGLPRKRWLLDHEHRCIQPDDAVKKRERCSESVARGSVRRWDTCQSID